MHDHTVVFSEISVFLVAPGGPVKWVPVNTTTQLSCHVGEEYNVTWAVQLPGETRSGDVDNPRVRDVLRTRGIIEEVHSSRESSLIINGSIDNNTTMVICVAFTAASSGGEESEPVQVIFYGN